MNREDFLDNNLFYTCSLIEYISRKTNNTKKDIVHKLGINNINKIYTMSDIYHCEQIEKVGDTFINEIGIEIGNYNYIDKCQSRIPTVWEIGRMYTRLIIMVNNDKEEYINTLIKVLSSFIIPEIDNYNSSLYYENPSYIYECYIEGKIL